MKTNKIKVHLSLNKQTVTKLEEGDQTAGLPPYWISQLMQWHGTNCLQAKSVFSGNDWGFPNMGNSNADCNK